MSLGVRWTRALWAQLDVVCTWTKARTFKVVSILKKRKGYTSTLEDAALSPSRCIFTALSPGVSSPDLHPKDSAKIRQISNIGGMLT